MSVLVQGGDRTDGGLSHGCGGGFALTRCYLRLATEIFWKLRDFRMVFAPQAAFSEEDTQAKLEAGRRQREAGSWKRTDSV
jgi:hypothetical protein